MDYNVITLTDDNGNNIDYYILDYIDIDKIMYLVLYKADGTDTEVLVVRVEDTDDLDKSEYIVETNQDIIDRVYKTFKENNNYGNIKFTD